MKMIDQCTIHENASVSDVLSALNSSGEGIALVVNSEKKLLGVITDGDIRRAFLCGFGLTEQIGSIVSDQFISVSPRQDRASVLDLMQARRLRHIPVVDEQGCLLGLHLLREMVGHDDKLNWAVIMAGGKGSRLGSLTAETPKPMLKVAGRPILERSILHLVHHGITRIFISVNHLSHVIEEYFGDGAEWGCTIDYLRENEPLGSGGALSLLPERPQHPLILMNGDLLIEADLSQMLTFHEVNNFYATMGVHYYSHEVPFGCVEVSGHRITGLEEKPLLTKTINGGVYVLSPEAVTTVPQKTFFPATSLFEEAFRQEKPCGVYPLDGDWIDIGLPDQLKQARGEC